MGVLGSPGHFTMGFQKGQFIMKKKVMILLCMTICLLILSMKAYSGDHTGVWHVVKDGETLQEIATHYDIEPKVLAKTNNILDWNFILAGTALWIPQGEMIEVYIYKVKRGDTLAKIAQKFNIDMWEIAHINKIYNMNLIYEKQTLYIPVSK
jgi:LysM repeat protein